MVAKKQSKSTSSRVTKAKPKSVNIKKNTVSNKKTTAAKKRTTSTQKQSRNNLKASSLDRLASLHKKVMAVGFSLVLLATAAIAITQEPLSYAATQNYVAVKTIGGKCLDNNGARAASGNRIQIYKCNSTKAQKVSFLDDKTIRIQGYCLDLYAEKVVSQTPIQLYSCKGYASQKWSIKNDGSIVNIKSGLCLDVHNGNTADRTQVQIYECNQTAAQKWVKINTLTPPTNMPTPPVTESTNPSPAPAPSEPSGPPRSNEEYGTYQPGPSTTGYDASTTLTPYNAETTDSFTLTKGGVIENKIIYGDLKYKGSDNLLIKNCLLVGGRHQSSYTSAIVDLNSTRSGVVTIQDSTIRARAPRDNRDGITGYKYRAYRNDVSKTVDGFGAFVVPSRAGTKDADIVIAGNYVHNLGYTYRNQTAHTDGTHNDGLQIQGGRNIKVTGNYFNMTSFTMPDGGTNPNKPWLIGTNNANGVGVMVQDNTGAGIDNTVIVEKNYFAKGLANIGIKPGINFVLSENKFYRETAYKPGGGWSGYWIRLDKKSGSVVQGLNAGTPSNRWIDGPYAGQLMSEPRDRGIHYNG
jgi:hypothetical protein